MKIAGIGFHHAGLSSSDLERSLRFYTEGLGGKLMRSWGEGTGRIAMVDMGGGAVLEIFANGQPVPEQNSRFVHLALHVDSPDEAYEKAMKAGASSYMEPQDMVLPSEPPCPIRVAFVKGPDGELLEFIHEK